MIGIKIGSFNSMVSSGTIKQTTNKYECNVLLSKSSKRVIPTILTIITQEKKFIGEEAKINFKRNYDSSFLNISRLISISYNSAFGKKEIDYYFKEKKYEKENNGFTIEINNKNYSIKIDSIISTFLKELNKYYSISENKNIEKIITNIPDYFTIPQMIKFKNLLEKSGIKSMLLNESVSITLYYFFSKYNDLFCHGDHYKYVIFIDIGHSQTSFIFSKFNYYNCEVIKSENHPFLGGRNIDEKLLTYLNNKFKESTQKEFISNKKAVVKIIEEIEKIKQNLSVNDEFMINIDVLTENTDFNCQFTRNDIKDLIKDIINSFSIKFNKFYNDCLKELEENEGISFIELISDLTRIPFFENEIKKSAKMPLSRTISSDENIACGNSLYCLLEEEKFPNKHIKSIFRRCKYSLFYNLNGIKDIKILNKEDKIPLLYSIDINLFEISYKTLSILFKYKKEEIEYFIDSEEIFKYNINLDKIRNEFKSAIQSVISLFININEEIELKYIKIINQKGNIFQKNLKEYLTENEIDNFKKSDIEKGKKLNENKKMNEESIVHKINEFVEKANKIKNKFIVNNVIDKKYQGNFTFGNIIENIILQVHQENNIDNAESILNQLVEDFCENISKISEYKKSLENKMNNCVLLIKKNVQFKNLEPQILSLKNSLFYVLSKDELLKIENEYDKIKEPIINFKKKKINNNNLNNK